MCSLQKVMVQICEDIAVYIMASMKNAGGSVLSHTSLSTSDLWKSVTSFRFIKQPYPAVPNV